MGKGKVVKVGLIIFGLLFIVAAYIFSNYYQRVFRSNTSVSEANPYLYVYSDWDRSDLIEAMAQQGILKDTASFVWVANKKHFLTPKAGKYRLKDGMNNNGLVNLLRSGSQEPVRLTFNSIRTPKDLAGKIAKQIEADSTELIQAISSGEIAAKYGFSRSTFLTLFIPNTYEVYWDMSAEEFIQRMAKEYKRFWTVARLANAKRLKLSQSEVGILASIVQAEQLSKPSERPKVAGLYINRMRKRMRLESDPTLIYGIGDFSIKRVLNKHKEVNSPYNTYKNAGLPPGPINLPEISSIDAVLYYENHDFIFMCAKPDFSGYHDFSRTYSQHKVYANRYHRELNKRKIMK
ncbi:MAG: endolytic transglycosylase MltG [Flavobacteriales bacterium]|nr:endolytic transglycosylase MltG [Flavobacteriales bacterium]